MRVISINLNGIRSAGRKGFYEWLATTNADIVCLQETRAQMSELRDELYRPAPYHCYFSDAVKKGYSGVGIYSLVQPNHVTIESELALFNEEGRYCRADYDGLSVISLYLPSGTSGEERQQIKYESLDFLMAQLKSLREEKRAFIICGDINIAHTKKDIKNWRGNQKNSGFLPEEREWMTQLFDEVGYVDAFRVINQEEDQYTWWSNRGKAYANNVGWRIDYQIVSPQLRSAIQRVDIYKDEKFSDHAPLIIDYSL